MKYSICQTSTQYSSVFCQSADSEDIKMEKFDKLIAKIVTEWSNSDCKEAVEFSVLLEDVVNNKKEIGKGANAEWRCSPPDLASIGTSHDNEGVEDILCLLR